MIGTSELRVCARAAAADVKLFRAALTSFLTTFHFQRSFMEDVSLAVGEVLANAVEHSSPGDEYTDLEMYARASDAKTLAIDVYDRGKFNFRERQEGRGYGFTIVRAIARDVSIATDDGTRVQMFFSNS